MIVGFILRKLWQRLTRQETRFGTAAVAFGTPLSMRPSGQNATIEGLSEDLLERIAQAMPVLTVPLVAQALLHHEPLSQVDLIEQAGKILAQTPAPNRTVQPEDLPVEVPRALNELSKRALIVERDGLWRISEEDREVLQFYANSIVHFLPRHAASAEGISAPAKT